MTCNTGEQVLTHYAGETKVYYVDFGDYIKGRYVVSILSASCADAALAISSASVLTSDVSDYDSDGNAVTIEANTGIQLTLSGGTAGNEFDDYSTTIAITITTSAGTEQAGVRVKVLSV